MAQIDYRRLGDSGLMVSTIGLGCNNFGRAGTATQSQAGTSAVIDTAVDAGITLFDTADIYGAERGLSETLMGHALQGKRDRIVLASKFGMDMNGRNGPDWDARGSRRYIRLAVEASLRRLQTDWIDLYQLHTPDPNTPIEETLQTLDDLIREGKVRYIGHSNLAGWQIAEAEFTARLHGHPRFISAQNEYSLLVRDAEEEVLPAVNAYGLGFLPFFPLYNGLFTGKFSRAGGPADSRIMMFRPHLAETAPWDVIEKYEAFCDEHGVTMLAATFAWLLAQPGLTSVIAGATRPEQVVQNTLEANEWQPTPEDVAWISDLFA
ncbi:aldo/keto reductase [Cryobacterium sp. TMT1-21]|uniref:aldo/keto reductase n=1 Tax=unclassified Cryobacterium TaxID=2649013 RepID=UPI001069459B|nr:MULTISPECIES: aldo/keto reductase [unclassified Cryobacterium]TFC80873.1 aldo/keto reductase [Cryobacterium sp. TmT2-59]TFD13200.1 aldo/keto reductase [Cryobacterium sp. TMT1-21]TFD18621.1 aldo/keto reductase [Cryobacterium sp. TMT4-10]TFD28421.1 aldo/keto reductase [Cryobacterium sp. TMT2-23]TFD36655.1 aldo/keto reductase [Cryobacterium sp. TMT2-10]